MQRLYFSISEVSTQVDEEQHILRYWEKEFPQLKPKKNRGGNRSYTQKDIDLIFLIKKLLRDDKLSLKGAKDYIKAYVNGDSPKLNLSDYQQKSSEPESSVQKILNTALAGESVQPEADVNVAIKREDLKQLLELMKKTLNLLKN